MAHVHAHAPHALTEPAHVRPARAERRLELSAVLLLALTTLATAWCGYQAARWSGEQSQNYARASATRIKAQPRTARGPLYLPQYKLADSAQSARLDAAADDLFAEGTDAKRTDDRYVLSTVFFAAVLFFAGISLRLDWWPLRIGVLALAFALLTGGVAFVLTLPVA
jgi:hypothetical protein